MDRLDAALNVVCAASGPAMYMQVIIKSGTGIIFMNWSVVCAKICCKMNHTSAQPNAVSNQLQKTPGER